MLLEHIQRSGGVCVGAFGSIAIAVWDETPTFEQAKLVTSILTRMSRTHEEFALVAVVGRNCSIPDGPIRELIIDEMRRCGTQIRALANVVESEGFAAAAVRAVVTGMAVILRPAHQVKTFTTIADATLFLKSFMPRNAPARQLNDVVTELRRR